VTREYSKLVISLWTKNKEPLDTKPLLTIFQNKFKDFLPGQQHDAHEAVLCLLDAFEKSLGLEYIKPIFYGKEEQVVFFPNGQSSRTNDFMSLFVDSVEHMKQYDKYNILSDYVDDSGKKHHVAAVTTSIKETGHCLTVIFTQKCPAELIPDTYHNLKLFGLVNHWGMSNGGHYAVTLKHKGQWSIVDDEVVMKIESPDPNVMCSMAWYKKM
jgi:ubiquitin C-terminal hydrolase